MKQKCKCGYEYIAKSFQAPQSPVCPGCGKIDGLVSQPEDLVELLICMQTALEMYRQALVFYADPTEKARNKYGVNMPDFYDESGFADVAIEILSSCKPALQLDINLAESTIDTGCQEAYRAAGPNAYFANGFRAGIKFLQSYIQKSI